MEAAHRVLIVDDESNVRETLEELLLSEGYELASACDGAEALAKAQAFSPDLILLDVMMPGMDGFEVCRRLRAHPLQAEVPVVMITGLDDRNSRLQGIGSGADDFITKPFDDTELQARVRTILRLNRYRKLLLERMQREQAEEALAQRITQLALLNKIGGRIAAMLEVDSLLTEAVHLVRDFGYPHVGLFTLDRGQGELLLRASAGALAPPITSGRRIALGQGLAGWVAHHGESLLVNDVATDARCLEPRQDEGMIGSELGVPLRFAEEVVGVLDIRSPRLNAFDRSDLMVMETLADQIATAMHNARLYEAERAARMRLRDLAGYLETARERERTYIAREIHDEFGQALTALKMDLTWLATHLPPERANLLAKVRAMSELVDSSVRMVRRIATNLRPGLLDHLGLVAAIEWQAQEFAARAGFECELVLDAVEPNLDPDLSTAVFRIFQETLTNVARHAEATKVCVELKEETTELVLIVKDNGRGITKRQTSAANSLGILGMQERARSWGGIATFQAEPGRGTTVTVRVPRMADREREG
jgi:signal transduction histidine kinase